MDLTTRNRNIVTGLIALVLVFALTTLGLKFSFGAFDDVYTLNASFDAAGQGLIKDSDVKVRGVNIGKVSSVKLVDGRALVAMRIRDGERVPRTAEAVVRPKTLFGEKFVDIVPGDGEGGGDYYADGDTIEHTLGGFELEKVLSDAYPVLKAIDPMELITVLDGFAEAGRGLGPAINRQLVNGAEVLDVFARHDADTQQFLRDLATISRELDGRADDLVAAADDLNVALPTLGENADDLNTLLVQAGRLATDVADLLQANDAFIDANFNEGQAVLDLLYDKRTQVVPLVVGLRQYVQTLAQVGRIEVGDGTVMAAVKGLLAGQICDFVACPGVAATAPAATAPAAPANPQLPPVPALPAVPLPELEVPVVSTGSQAVVDLVTGLLGRGPRR
jgi:virulence factor Mce-like protein